jgi:hypothetical protein
LADGPSVKNNLSERSEFIGSVTHDALQALSLLLSCGKIKLFEITGETLYRGSADIQLISFEKEYNPEEAH